MAAPSSVLRRLVYIFTVTAVLIALAMTYRWYQRVSDHAASAQHGDALPTKIVFNQHIKPVLTQRCVVCHSCYDAPCQLKLSSVEGIERGAIADKVYYPKRLQAAAPTRLFIDAKTTQQWRDKGFHSVLQPEAGLLETEARSLMQRLLALKQQHPQADSGKLSDTFTLDINRDQVCPDQNEFEDYAEEHPEWGMPYAMPNLTEQEYRLLDTWLQQGAELPVTEERAGKAESQVTRWEAFLNLDDNRHKLVSRYIYEHLFHAHIHFKGTPPRELYRLVRSTTPPGEPVDEIATVRPYDDPGSEAFYYRLRRYTPTVVAKNHILYEWSDARMQRYRELFFETDYKVEVLPGYDAGQNANPFKIFAAIPPDSRYRFMLDESRFFIEGFIKGPVCRGQVALNVIEDQFWVVFFDPDQSFFTTQAEFLNSMSDYLHIPSERGSDLNMLAIWSDYWQKQKQYLATKERYFKRMNTHSLQHAMSYIWDGVDERHPERAANPNAAITVFRHFDSASVEYGFVGKPPETAWVIDYPLFERIHYLLVAGFNVYGNLVHQLSTRIYMDFLRMEGEDHFLAFLPVSRRKQIRDSWYQGIREELDTLFRAPMDWLSIETVIGYQTDDVQNELYGYIQGRLDGVLQHDDSLNLCGRAQCNVTSVSAVKQHTDTVMEAVSALRGMQLHDFPEVAFVRVITGEPDNDPVYSIVRNKAYKNVVSLLSDERERDKSDIQHDTVTVVDWLVGSYPNFFFNVKLDELEQFAQHCARASTQEEFDSLIEKYGVRRTDSRFWKTADWFHARYAAQRPLHSGLYDLSRYSNL